jgi:glycine oxidase
VAHTTNKRSYDAVIVGAGVIGLSCAWRAAQRGLDVLVLERSVPASGATGVAAGMLAPVGELTLGERQLLEMTLASAEAFPEFVTRLESASGQRVGYARIGALHIALDRDEAAELRRIHELQQTLRLDAEWLTPRRCRELEPGLAPSFAGGVHAPHEAAVSPRALTAALLAALEAEGAEVRNGAAVCDALIENGRVGGVRTTAGEEALAAHVVLAAGCWSGAADWLPPAARPPVRPVKGQILELRGPAKEPVCERIVASERVYVVPRDGGRLIVGATVEERGFELAVTAGGVYELLREAYRLLPEVAELELVEASAGLRPGTPDNLPLIGSGVLEGLVLATGHFRNGVLLAPLTAEAVAAVLAGDEVSGPARAASPERLSPRSPATAGATP